MTAVTQFCSFALWHSMRDGQATVFVLPTIATVFVVAEAQARGGADSVALSALRECRL